MKTKALVLDIDGTLTNTEKEITPATKAAILAVLNQGHKVILASGRPAYGMRRYAEELELMRYGGYLLSHNGARVLDYRTGNVIFQKAVPPELLPDLVDFARKNGCGLATHSEDTVISAFPPDDYVSLEARINGMPVRVAEDFVQYVDFDIYKCFMTADGKRAAELEKELRKLCGSRASVYRSEAFFIEIVPENVDKGASLARLVENIGIGREDVVCCGDGFNDISMLCYAGVGVAMGNAGLPVKEAADYVTAGNDEDGLVPVIEKFIQAEFVPGSRNGNRGGRMKRDIRIRVPQKGQYIIDTIRNAGFDAYVVGGCVRDSILNREPEDWDITTSAKPEQVKALFARTIDTGLQHGTVTVMLDKDGFEVTTYRLDGEYEDGRHPKSVTFTSDLEEDLKRRDLTINAMAYNDREGLVDLFGGMDDLEAGVIRCVGNPEERFREDALRILRAIRFSAQLGYTIEAGTLKAIGQLAPTLARISAERIQTELVKLLMSPHPEYLRTAYDNGVTKVFLPEFDTCMETAQNHPHHCCSVGEHILHSLREVEADRVLRLTMLFHDMGKPAVLAAGEDGVTHFHGHAAVSADMARTILHRLKFDNDTIHRVCRLVLYHDYGNGVVCDRRIVRRALNKIGTDAFPGLFAVKRADIMAQSDYQRREKLENLDRWQKLYEEILEKQECVSLKDLALDGSDLIAAGWQPGRELGETLQKLLELVLEDPELNTREGLAEAARHLKR